MTRQPGFFVAIDGPSGIGKSSVTAHLGRRLSAVLDRPVLTTKEPTSTTLGNLARFGTDQYHGLTLACLVAADRYHHLEHDIRPALAAGKLVVCDRYIASSLVLQRMDEVPPDFLWHLNALADPPDLYVILTGDPARSRARAAQRGLYSRFHRGGQTAGAVETALYRTAATDLQAAGWNVLIYEVAHQTTAEVADDIGDAVLTRMTEDQQ
jgi:dTMP kinase